MIFFKKKHNSQLYNTLLTLSRNIFFYNKIGLKEQLSATRANGLLSMIKQMKLYAIAIDK